MSRNGKFLFGAMLGALFGLAFAPKKGSDLRKELQDELVKGGKGDKTLKKNAATMGKDIATTAKEVYEDPQVQSAIKKGRKEAGKVVDQVKKEIQENSEEWVKLTREKLIEGKASLEKEASKTIDSIKKKVIHPKKGKK